MMFYVFPLKTGRPWGGGGSPAAFSFYKPIVDRGLHDILRKGGRGRAPAWPRK
jgi:hypothetical protein